MSTETRDFTKLEAVNWIYTHNLGLIFPNYDNKNRFTHFTSRVPIRGLSLPDGWYCDKATNTFNKLNPSAKEDSCIKVINKD